MFGHLVWNQSSEELRLDRFDDLLSVVTFFRQFIGIFYFGMLALCVAQLSLYICL